MAQISTAISDFVLSLSSFYGAGVVFERNKHASLGLLLVGVAAGVGTVRFLDITPVDRRNGVISLHSKLSWLATILGMPLIAAAFCIKYRKANSSQLHIISAVAGIIFSIMFPKIQDVCTWFPSSLAIFSILVHCYQADNMLGVIGAVIYAISGTLIGTSGELVSYDYTVLFRDPVRITPLAFGGATVL